MPVGVLAEPARKRGSDFAQLSKRVNEAGLMARRPWWYAAKIAFTSALFIGGWVAFFVVGNSWWQLLVAVFLAVATTQVAFLGHDAGHRQMFRTRRPSEVFGLVAGNLAIGLSYGWWMDKHTRHHANPNHEDEDPDVAPGALAWTREQALARTGGLGRWLARWQAYLFFPLLTLEGLNLHAASFRALKSAPMRYRRLEAVLLGVHVVAYLAVVFTVLSPGLALLFIAVHQGLWGVYMGCSFAPNHKGMPMLTAEDDVDFLRKQVLTSRNVRGGKFVDFALGGLNYQIEHHLFPSMARPNLRKAQPIVEAYCAEQGIAYEATGLIDSYSQALRHLHDAGNPPR
ncbi:acyl-CoA desaturase [Phytohabitans flavus]|uniref:Delta fatty acid desaturase n=1 Tax=Phytohabitans flavus TaxID=1076124 RepID=A0A6F8Y6R0_9ACTN|nr:acyl-CoA desaturase [Phytohabitans flavus]BCB81750.1 delta fatty acid desaturase [Phytohabitans flavus]